MTKTNLNPRAETSVKAVYRIHTAVCTRTHLCALAFESECRHTVHLVSQLIGAKEGRADKKRLRERFQKRGPIYIRCHNWFVCAEQGGGGGRGGSGGT
jgi:hypothetical protein